MASVMLQFHASREEIGGLLRDWLDGSNWHGVAMGFTGSRRVFRFDEIDEVALVADVYDLMLSDKPMADEPGWTDLEFGRRNLGGLDVYLPRSGEAYLNEMSLSAMSETQDLLHWKRAIRRARRSLARGATVVGALGHVSYEASHRYSKGALALAEAGMAMTTAGGGGPLWFFDGLPPEVKEAAVQAAVRSRTPSVDVWS